MDNLPLSLTSLNRNFFLVGPFVAGILAFVHCSVMCGPLVLLFRRQWAGYQLGRIAGYTAVGALLGVIGLSLDKAGMLLSVQNFSIYIAIFLMLLYGIGRLLPAKSAWKGPSFIYLPSRWIGHLRRNQRIPAVISVTLAGVLSALIPCAVLYPVWALAAGSGSPLYGAGVAFAFVMGTIPGLLAIQLLTGKLSERIPFLKGNFFRTVSVVLMLATGIAMVGWREKFAPRMDFSEEAAGKDIQCLPGHENDPAPAAKSGEE